MNTCFPARRASAGSFIPLLAMLALLACAPALRADQTEAEATTILTNGEWHFGGRNTGRFFNEDGTYRSSNATIGLWKIANRAIEIHLGEMVFVYPLPLVAEGTPGADHQGRKSLLIRVGAEGPGGAPEENPWGNGPAATSSQPNPIHMEQSASQLVRAYHASLVFATGTAGAGSGFIARMAGSNFLVTNAHVAAEIRDAEFKSLDGAVIHRGVPSLAIGEDIFCMALPAGGSPLPVMQDVDQNAAIGDDVAVLGNAQGAGVVRTITGRIVGIGPNLVEVDAPFVPGNSGSPIIHLKTGKVIGVATYTLTQDYDLTTDKKLPRPEVRRFGYRLDSVKGWQAVNWAEFNAQAERMDSIKQLTDDLTTFFRNSAQYHSIDAAGLRSNPEIMSQIEEWNASRRPHESPEDVAEANANFLSFLKVDCEADVTAAQSRITYDYFRRELADQKQARDEMAKGFEEIIQAEGQ